MEHDLPDVAWLTALSYLPKAGPRRLCALLDRWDAQTAWQAVCDGRPEVAEIAGRRDRASEWRSFAHALDVASTWEQHRAANLGVVGRHSAALPAVLATDLEPPAVLFVDGDMSQVHPQAVAVVGTRRCTQYGIDIAFELGAMLSAAGVTVVSGLALGIDAAAHAGALDAGGAPPVAVVANDLSRPYPRQNAALWRAVADVGAVLTEAPLGTPLARWRFPARNRLVAALSLVTVVVESEEKGGSLYTAAEAVSRQRPVLAVPGPIRSPASAGTNRLLADGHHPVCAISDVLEAVGLVAVPTGPQQSTLAAELETVLAAFCWQPVTLEQLVDRLQWSVAEVAARLAELDALQLVVRRGRFLERAILL